MDNQSAAQSTSSEKVAPIRDDLRPSTLAPDELAEFHQFSEVTLKVQSEIGALYCDRLALDAEYAEKAAQYDAQIGKLKAQLDGHARVLEAMKHRLTRKYGMTPESKVDLKTGEIIY